MVNIILLVVHVLEKQVGILKIILLSISWYPFKNETMCDRSSTHTQGHHYYLIQATGLVHQT